MPTSATLPAITPPHLALHYTRFANWFPLYRRHSPKATVIDLLTLQPDFLDWLEEDGIVLPPRSEAERDGEEGDEEDEDDSDEDAAEPRNFDSLNNRIRQVLTTYDGAVFPKLDWSAPLDAAWIVPGSTLRCTTPSDVYLLLKSSDFVSKDLNQLRELDRMTGPSSGASESPLPLATGVRPILVLKKFFTIPTSHEFRCFVRAGRLTCISQRDTGTFFEHLQGTEFQWQVRTLLQEFFRNVLTPSSIGSSDSNTANGITTHPTSVPFPIDDFVWDAYISRDMSRVFLVDINPFLERTDGLLWTWSEVEDIAEKWSRGEASSDEENDDDEDDRTFMRVYTDGRPPVLMRADPEEDSSLNKPRREPLPHLRIITSRAQTTQSFPTYARNMIPSEVVGAAEGNNIAEFARQWNEKIALAAIDGVDEDDAGVDYEIPSLPGR